MLEFDTLISAREAIGTNKVSAAELTRRALERIGRLDPTIQAFNSVADERALARAEAVDEGAAAGGALAGGPVAIKDKPCTSRGAPTCSAQLREKLCAASE